MHWHPSNTRDLIAVAWRHTYNTSLSSLLFYSHPSVDHPQSVFSQEFAFNFFYSGVNLDVCSDSCCLTPPCGPFPLGGRHNDQWRRGVCLFFSRNVSGERPLPGPWALASAHTLSVDAVLFSTPLPNVKNSTICARHGGFGGTTDAFHLSKGWNGERVNCKGRKLCVLCVCRVHHSSVCDWIWTRSVITSTALDHQWRYSH